jgi:hypothetical protein
MWTILVWQGALPYTYGPFANQQAANRWAEEHSLVGWRLCQHTPPF